MMVVSTQRSIRAELHINKIRNTCVAYRELPTLTRIKTRHYRE